MKGFEVVGDASLQGYGGGFLIGFLVPLFGIGKGVHAGDLNFVRGRGVGAQVEIARVVTGDEENIVTRDWRNDVAIHFLTIVIITSIRGADESIPTENQVRLAIDILGTAGEVSDRGA